MLKLPPIVIFTYRRLNIEKVINSLLKNNLALESDLIIYSDGNKNQEDLKDILEVRKYLHTISGFKSIDIIESETNKGLANSIISGVSEVINKYGKAIVLEDDLIVSNDFLEYMNEALDYYENNDRIWSISGYGPNLPELNNYDKDIYLSPRSTSWGWATWQDRWEKTDWSIKDYDSIKNSKQLQSEFNLGGDDLYKMLELQMLGKIDSWAIRWCYNQFKYNKYAIYPKFSKIINDGFNDNVGTHNSSTADDKWIVKAHNNKVKFEHIGTDENILKSFQEYHNLSTFTKIGYFLRKNGGYKLVKKLLKAMKK